MSTPTTTTTTPAKPRIFDTYRRIKDNALVSVNAVTPNGHVQFKRANGTKFWCTPDGLRTKYEFYMRAVQTEPVDANRRREVGIASPHLAECEGVGYREAAERGEE